MPPHETATAHGDQAPRRRSRRVLARSALYMIAASVFIWWILSPLKWWLPGYAGKRSSGTTVGCVDHDVNSIPFAARG